MRNHIQNSYAYCVKYSQRVAPKQIFRAKERERKKLRIKIQGTNTFENTYKSPANQYHTKWQTKMIGALRAYVCAFCRSFVIDVCVYSKSQTVSLYLHFKLNQMFWESLVFFVHAQCILDGGNQQEKKKERQYFARQLPIELFSVLVSIALGIVSIYVSSGHCVYTRK